MSKKPVCRSMNFSVYEGKLNRYKDSEDLKQSYELGDLNGLEVVRAGVSDQGKITPDMVNGVHLYYHIFWMDWWKGDYKRLDAEFDTRKQWLDYYGGCDKEVYLKMLRQEMEYAESVGAKYVVFHASEVTLRESYVEEFRYSDEEVVDACLEIINTLLDEREYSFDFLVENLWWSGLNMKNGIVTKRMIEGIHSEKKGIMLDFGHYMNTNSDLRTGEEAVAYIHDMLDAHEQLGLLTWIKGVHLHMSLSGEYVKELRAEWEEGPMDFDKIPFYELLHLVNVHFRDIDLHQPFLCEGVKELVERIAPDYITFEFRQNSRKEYEDWIVEQSRVLGYKN